MNLEVKVKTFSNGVIEISDEIKDKQQNVLGSICKKVIETEDNLVKGALINLGWTPPANAVNLKDTPELLEDGEWYPVVSNNGYDCLTWLEHRESFYDSSMMFSCQFDCAEWIGPKIQFPSGDKNEN